MSRWTERLGIGGLLRLGNVPSEEVVRRLEAGEALSVVGRSLGLEPLDLIAALAFDALGGKDAVGPPLVQASPQRPRLATALSEPSLAPLFPGVGRPARLAISAGLLQIHDFWDASHNAAQQAEDQGERMVSAYWHGIAHRREPDPGNASYWFRRVGRHPVFAELARSALPLLDAANAGIASALLPKGNWEPYAFIDFCGRARGEDARLARAIQKLEMTLLLDATLPS